MQEAYAYVETLNTTEERWSSSSFQVRIKYCKESLNWEKYEKRHPKDVSKGLVCW